MDITNTKLTDRLLNNYLKHKKRCQINAKKLHEKLKDNEDYKKKKNEKAKEYYNKNKSKILEKSKSARNAQKEQNN